MKFWKEWLKKLTSRKFLLAIVSALIVFGNKYWGWELSETEVITMVSGLLLFIGIEGWVDAKRAENS